MSISSSIGRCLMVLMLAQGIVAHAADDVDGDGAQGFAGMFKSSGKQTTTKLESPQAAAPEPQVRVLDKVDVERERLANLMQEVAYLRHQVSDTARQAPGATRVQFRYDWLDRDLEMIQRGIQEHFDAPRQPRPVAPLKGSYRR